MPLFRSRPPDPAPGPHAAQYASHADEIAALREKLGAMADYHVETSDASERRHADLKKELAAEVGKLREELHALAARLPAAEPAPPAPDGTGVLKKATTRRTAAERAGTAPAGKDGGTA